MKKIPTKYVYFVSFATLARSCPGLPSTRWDFEMTEVTSCEPLTTFAGIENLSRHLLRNSFVDAAKLKIISFQLLRTE